MTRKNLAAACAVWCVFAVFAQARTALAAPGRDAFDGKWVIQLTSDDPKAKPFEDTLTFKNGKLTSEKLKKEGFKEAEYEADVRGGQAATFTATAKGKNDATAKWTGTVVVGELQGTLVWTKPGGAEVTYDFKGKRAN